ncbi:replication initiator [Micromonospora carbonacea]|uniref:replication initiator n=1 Tax=Micromonospora carbonacea TaxID=47853 RepID=UPI003D9DE536
MEPGTVRILAEQHTDELPDRTLYKACANRRAAQCPDCAWVCAGDAFQVVRCGLTGGKTIPSTLARQAVAFATFTAPSFGPVHSPPHLRWPAALRLPAGILPRPEHRRRLPARAGPRPASPATTPTIRSSVDRLPGLLTSRR